MASGQIWQILERMRELNYSIEITANPVVNYNGQGAYMAKVWLPDGTMIGRPKWYDNPCIAILLAARKAIGGAE